MEKLIKIYNKIVEYLTSKYKVSKIKKSNKSFSMYVIIDNKKVRISNHKNNYSNSDLSKNIIYDVESSIYNILNTLEKELKTLIQN